VALVSAPVDVRVAGHQFIDGSSGIRATSA
jgi:hypothetical protein